MLVLILGRASSERSNFNLLSGFNVVGSVDGFAHDVVCLIETLFA